MEPTNDRDKIYLRCVRLLEKEMRLPNFNPEDSQELREYLKFLADLGDNPIFDQGADF